MRRHNKRRRLLRRIDVPHSRETDSGWASSHPDSAYLGTGEKKSRGVWCHSWAFRLAEASGTVTWERKGVGLESSLLLKDTPQP